MHISTIFLAMSLSFHMPYCIWQNIWEIKLLQFSQIMKVFLLHNYFHWKVATQQWKFSLHYEHYVVGEQQKSPPWMFFVFTYWTCITSSLQEYASTYVCIWIARKKLKLFKLQWLIILLMNLWLFKIFAIIVCMQSYKCKVLVRKTLMNGYPFVKVSAVKPCVIQYIF